MSGRGRDRLSVAGYLLLNFLTDTLLLALALRSAGRRVTARVLIGGGAGAVYALACLRHGQLRSPPCQALMMAAMLALAGKNALRAATAAAMAALSAALGGTAQWLLPSAGLGVRMALAAAAVLLAGCMLQDRRRLNIGQLNIRVRVEHHGQVSEFDALIDTGNRMTEPLSGLPVLIVESHCLPQIASVSRAEARCIPYSGLGGQGFLRAFRPDGVYRRDRGKWQAVSGVWAAAFPGRIGGEFRALAPAVFALTGENGHTRGEIQS